MSGFWAPFPSAGRAALHFAGSAGTGAGRVPLRSGIIGRCRLWGFVASALDFVVGVADGFGGFHGGA
ncbi:MAG: hypothetical protein ACKVWR_18720, partial [Acidimicrobiales bacterium]